MGCLETILFSLSMFLLVAGLVLQASGFGVLAAGHLDGILLAFLGISMFWGGWVFSGAHGFSYATAAALNMLDAALTLSFWALEVNPFVRTVEPSLFLVVKVACSLAIVAYARSQEKRRRAGLALTGILSLIVAWNIGQHVLMYLGLGDFSLGILLGIVFTLAVSVVILSVLIVAERKKYCEL